MGGPSTKMLLFLALLVMAGHSTSAAVQCLCSDELKERGIDFAILDDFFIAGNVMEVVMAKTKLHCGAKCSSHDFCKSFNFERYTGRCELTSDLSTEVTPVPRPGFTLGQTNLCSKSEAMLCAGSACPNTSRIMVKTESGFCVSPDCPGSVPTSADYRLKAGEFRLTEGTVVGVATQDPAYCPVDKVSPQNESVACGYDGNWSLPPSSRCRRPASCADVKLCDPTSPDGEYWLYPAVFGSQTKVKVYCHEEHAGVVREYVTMSALNRATSVGRLPLYRNCTEFEQHWSVADANITFRKFRLASLDFRLEYQDSSSNLFTSGVGAVYFFWNYDCMTRTDDNGSFYCSNMGNGGFLFNSSLSGYILEYDAWGVHGDLPLVLTQHQSPDKRELYMSCTGNCGSCYVSGARLVPDPDYVPPDSEATFCWCPL